MFLMFHDNDNNIEMKIINTEFSIPCQYNCNIILYSAFTHIIPRVNFMNI